MTSDARSTYLPVTVTRGDTRRIGFRVRDKNGDIVDISTWANFLLTVTTDKKPIDDSTKVAQFVGQKTSDGTDGRMYFVPLGTLPAAKMYYDIQVRDGNAEKSTIAHGEYIVTQDRTKD